MQQNPQRFHYDHHDKHRCLGCARHRAVFTFRGRVRADADHNLCPRCYRSHRQRLHNWFAVSFRADARNPGTPVVSPASLVRVVLLGGTRAAATYKPSTERDT
jgi:hypothetical protein